VNEDVKFVYTEDRDVDTGHGWRDVPHRLYATKNGRIRCVLLDKETGEELFTNPLMSVTSSYAWITAADSFERTRCAAADELRTSDLNRYFTGFAGEDDMEGHFEFQMCPLEMREYLESLGIENSQKEKSDDYTG